MRLLALKDNAAQIKGWRLEAGEDVWRAERKHYNVAKLTENPNQFFFTKLTSSLPLL